MFGWKQFFPLGMLILMIMVVMWLIMIDIVALYFLFGGY